jgi:hypothetical protein
MGVTEEFCGVENVEDEGGVTQTQEKYISAKLHELELTKRRAKQRFDTVTPEERHGMKSLLGAVRWVQKTAPEAGYELAKLSTWVSREDCCVQDIMRTNKLVRVLRDGLTRQTPHQPHIAREKPRVRLPRFPESAKFKVVVVVDAGEPKDERGYCGKWHGAILIGLMIDDWADVGLFSTVYSKSGHITRVAHSSFDGETLVAIEGIDLALSSALLVEEFESGPRMGMWDRKLMQIEGVEFKRELEVPLELHTDYKDLVDRTRKITFDANMAKRRKCDVADLQELETLGILRPIVKIAGPKNPVDCGTKEMSFESGPYMRLCELVRDGVYEPYL